MGRIQAGSFRRPDEIVPFPGGENLLVRVGDMSVGRDAHEVGFRWSTHIRPMVGGEWCQFYHRGVILRGRLHVLMDDGEEAILDSDAVFVIPPGHDAWVEGDEPVVTISWVGAEGWAKPPSHAPRSVITILFIDIVGSTEQAARLGDAAWNRRKAVHDDTVRGILADFGGREIETAGDSFLVAFESAAAGVRCAAALVAAGRGTGVRIRAGIHTGEVEEGAGGLRGVAVSYAARVTAAAAGDEVLVSAVTRELAEGSGLRFVSRGRHALKGFDGERELFALAPEAAGR